MGTSTAMVMRAGSEVYLRDLIYTLRHKIEETTNFYAAEILCGLEHLRNLKIVHVFIKTSSIFILRSGHVLMIDFEHSLNIS